MISWEPYDFDLLVASNTTHQVLRYDGVTGAFEGVFASVGGRPRGLIFGTDGDLFVTRDSTDQVLRFDGSTGAFEGFFATAIDPYGLTFGLGGDLFVASRGGDNKILRFDGVTGASKGVFASVAGPDAPNYLLFTPRAVPEPSSLLLMGLGALGMIFIGVRRRNRGRIAG